MGLSRVPETIGFAFQKGLTQVWGPVLGKAIPSFSSYCSDSEESQMLQMVAGPGRWKSGQGGTDSRDIIMDIIDQPRGGFSIEMLAMNNLQQIFKGRGHIIGCLFVIPQSQTSP